MTPPQRVVVVGQGYVGLPVAMRAVEVGHDVVGLDVDGARVSALRQGRSYVEDVPDRILAGALASGRYSATTDSSACAGFRVAVITVPTPLREGVPDLSFIEDAVGAVSAHLTVGATVVLESTTYPGTTDELLVPILEQASGLKAGPDFHVGYSPERIDPGNRRWTFVNTPKVVSGIDAASLAAVQAFYDTLVDRTVPVTTPAVAELTKLLENTFRHVNVALVNELAMFASDLGADVWAAIDAASTKPFGFMRFLPGPGVGGHCLPIDPSYLSWRVRRRLGTPFRFVELANEINDHMPDYVVRRLMVALNHQRLTINGSRILLLGMAYKANSSDTRGAPAAAVAQQLLTLGAEVRVADPMVSELSDPRLTLVDATDEELRAATAVVLLTDHDEFDYAAIEGSSRYLLDTRRRLRGPQVEYL